MQNLKYNNEISSILNEITSVGSETNTIINTTTSSNVDSVYTKIRSFSDDYEQLYHKCSDYPELSQIQNDIQNVRNVCDQTRTAVPNQMIDMLDNFAIEESTLKLDIVYFDNYK